MKIRTDRVIFAVMVLTLILLVFILLLMSSKAGGHPDVNEAVIIRHDLSTDERQSQRALTQTKDGVLKVYTDTGELITITERERND